MKIIMLGATGGVGLDSTERVDTRVLEVIYRFRDAGAKVYDGQQMDVFIAENHGGAQ